MPPRPPGRLLLSSHHHTPHTTARYASLLTTSSATSTTTDPPPTPIRTHPRTQPPSHKPPHFRKSQLLRQYQSLLRSTPLLLIFQHNNLRAIEWMGIRRELSIALQKADEEVRKQRQNNSQDGLEELEIASTTKLQVVQTGIFAAAVRILEFWDPSLSSTEAHALSTPAHTLSHTSSARKKPLPLTPLLTGPLALLTLPSASPTHLAAALSILSPSTQFPAPKRRARPGYHEPAVLAGVQKLMLLGAKVEGRVMDLEGVKWVGGIEGGLEGERGRLVQMLEGVGVGLAGTLESAGKSLWGALEGRRGMLEEEGKKEEGSV